MVKEVLFLRDLIICLDIVKLKFIELWKVFWDVVFDMFVFLGFIVSNVR